LEVPVTLYARFAAHLDAVLRALEGEGALAPGLDRGAVAVEPPRDAAHGDLATNAARVQTRQRPCAGSVISSPG
jgi:arginyl-tRNA synthetase